VSELTDLLVYIVSALADLLVYIVSELTDLPVCVDRGLGRLELHRLELLDLVQRHQVVGAQRVRSFLSSNTVRGRSGIIFLGLGRAQASYLGHGLENFTK
jgi:hypothetical protein